MKLERDVVIAIIIGVLIGTLAAFIIFFLPKFFPKPTPKLKEVTKREEQPTPPSITSALLTLESPQDEAVFSEDEIWVSGKTKPGALVVITTPLDETVLEADNKGGFEGKVSLEEGANEINVTAYQEENEETKSLTVYYTKEEI